MTPTTAIRAIRALRTGEMKFAVLDDSLIALTDDGLACLRSALEAAPDLDHGYCFAADLRSLLCGVKCIQRYRAMDTTTQILCRV